MTKGACTLHTPVVNRAIDFYRAMLRRVRLFYFGQYPSIHSALDLCVALPNHFVHIASFSVF